MVLYNDTGNQEVVLCMSCFLWFSLTQQGASWGLPSKHCESGYSRSLQVLSVLTKNQVLNQWQVPVCVPDLMAPVVSGLAPT